VRNWRRADWAKMRSEMGRVNWQRELIDGRKMEQVQSKNHRHSEEECAYQES
jgi:hypothetical protein